MRGVLQLLGWGFAFAFYWLIAVTGLMIDSPSGGYDRAWAVHYSGWLFVAYWILGSSQLLWLKPDEWVRNDVRLILAVEVMWLGLMAHLVHVLLAFAEYHDFSHARAVEHTARTAGVGWGVYVNYLFASVWLADTLWLTTATRSYARRPRWVGVAVHGFLAFIVFNATVVYGEPAVRVAGGVWFAILATSWWRRSLIAARRASEGGGYQGRTTASPPR